MKAVLRGKLIALSASIKEEEENIHQQLNSASGSSRIKRSKYTQEEQNAGNNQLRAKINQVEKKKKKKKKKKGKGFLGKINNIDKPLVRL